MFASLLGHTGSLVGFRAVCSCGWTGPTEYPDGETAEWGSAADWGAHIGRIAAVTPPDWLLNRSDGLRDNLTDLAQEQPLQALGVLAAIEQWQRPLLQQAVDAARANGSSWAEIGTALGVTKQSAHERFSAPKRRRSAAE
ncbi:hypothetical protein [Cryptosporangium sp. NPDC048952]|uniref:hypothetical protein n=1 Tax=Cryptosporangium sp. NPDC048952 TaxID=3363961 RepID=UPI0037151BEC